MTPLVVVGAGGHAREVLDVVDAVNDIEPTFELVGVAATGGTSPELGRRGIETVWDPSVVLDLPADVEVVIAIGDGRVRRRIDEELAVGGRRFAVLVHPVASVGSDVVLGPGAVLAAGARVTTNVRLGRHVHVNVNAVVSHDCRVGDYATLSPGVHLNGTVTVGRDVFFGTGAIVTPGCRIGSGAVVGAGAVVLGDVDDGVTVVGVPARPVVLGDGC